MALFRPGSYSRMLHEVMEEQRHRPKNVVGKLTCIEKTCARNNKGYCSMNSVEFWTNDDREVVCESYVEEVNYKVPREEVTVDEYVNRW